MYFLFKYKNMMPHEFNQLGYYEKIILSIFMQKELEERSKELNINGGY